MTKVARVLAVLLVCSLALVSCDGLPPWLEKYVDVNMWVEPGYATLCDETVLLTATIDVEYNLHQEARGGNGPMTLSQSLASGYGGFGRLEAAICWQWFKDGSLVGASYSTDYESAQSSTFSAVEPGVYHAVMTLMVGECPVLALESNHVTVAPCGAPCTRADVSVVIYGGWDGIPVKAWVGGTEQETMTTEHDAFGEAAVLWTFYPPFNGWTVSVAPQTPAGKDPERWQYKLVRIESPTCGMKDDNPTGASAKIYPCNTFVFYFQLVDTGE